MTWWKLALAGIAALAMSTTLAPKPAEAGRVGVGYGGYGYGGYGNGGPAWGYGYRSTRYAYQPSYYRSTFYQPHTYQYPRYWWYYEPYPHYGYHPQRFRPAGYGYDRRYVGSRSVHRECGFRRHRGRC